MVVSLSFNAFFQRVYICVHLPTIILCFFICSTMLHVINWQWCKVFTAHSVYDEFSLLIIFCFIYHHLGETKFDTNYIHFQNYNNIQSKMLKHTVSKTLTSVNVGMFITCHHQQYLDSTSIIFCLVSYPCPVLSSYFANSFLLVQHNAPYESIISSIKLLPCFSFTCVTCLRFSLYSYNTEFSYVSKCCWFTILCTVFLASANMQPWHLYFGITLQQ